MALVIPNIESSPNFDGQSVSDDTDWAAALALGDLTGVVSGCGVTQDTGSDMKVAVASGTVWVAGVSYSVAATGGSPLTVGAASTFDRRDIVVYTVSTGLQVVAGTQCATAGWTRTSTGLPPVKPAIPASSVLLGEIYVAHTTTVITTAANIIDKTALFGVLTALQVPLVEATVTFSSTPAIDTDNANVFKMTGASGSFNLSTSLTGTGTPTQKWQLNVADNGTPQTITLGSAISANGFTIPGGTTKGSTTEYLRLLFEWNELASIWDLVSVV